MNNMKAYIKMARPDHWIKHILIIPGIAIAYLLTNQAPENILVILIGFASACLIASANYVINEWLDAETDKHHPLKKQRAAVQLKLSPWIVYTEYLLLGLSGLLLAYSINIYFFSTAFVFFIMGIIYNVKPFRSKDLFILDVLSESINNPLRFLLGWFMITSTSIPPISIIIGYWFSGAFLMGAKRLAEYRHITKVDSLKNLTLYRKSFGQYSERSLITSLFSYALISIFMFTVFFVKYRLEYILIFPFLVALFTYYIYITLEEASVTQTPEGLFKNKGLILILLLLSSTFVSCTFYDMPKLELILKSQTTNIDQFLKQGTYFEN